MVPRQFCKKTCLFSNKMFLVWTNCIFAVPKKHKSEKNKIKWPPTTTIFLFFNDLFHKLHLPHHFCNLPQNQIKLQTTLQHIVGAGQVFAFALNNILNKQKHHPQTKQKLSPATTISNFRSLEWSLHS